MSVPKPGNSILSSKSQDTDTFRWPADFRKFMGWIFLGWSLLYLNISLNSILYGVHWHSAPFFRSLLVAPIFTTVVAFTLTAAWWTVWKGKSSAKGCAVAASLILILIFARQFVVPLRPAWDYQLGALFAGIIGLFAFLWGDKD